jgi:hypothetical protein
MESSIMVPVVLIGGLFALAMGVIIFNYLQTGNVFKFKKSNADTRQIYVQAPRDKQKAVAKTIEDFKKPYELLTFDFGGYESFYSATYNFDNMTPIEVEKLVTSIIESVGDEKSLRIKVS